VIVNTGEIGYVTGGKFPIRKYNVAQGAYTKKGHLSDNLWQGFVPALDKAYTVNPSQGFFVSANNYITSKNSKHGYSHAFAFTHRAMRITELIEEQISQGTLFTADTLKVI
jgi:penicillin G amidase